MVTIRQRLRQLVSGKAEPAPKAVAAGGTARAYFAKVERTLEALQRYQTIYEQGGPIAEAIDAYALTVLSNGYRLEGDEGLARTTQERLDSFEFESVMYEGIVQALVLGDAFQECTRTRIGANFLRVDLRDSTRFTVRQNPATGVVEGYSFLPPGEWDQSRAVPLEVADMVHLVIHRKAGSPYGRSLIQRAYDDIMRDTKTAEGTAAAIERHGFPKFHVRVGAEGEEVAKEDLDAIGTQFESLSAKHDFVTCRDVEIGAIDTGGLPGADVFSNISTSRLCAALGVPAEVLGLDYKGSTEATANVRLRVWYDKCAAIQRRVAPVYSQQVIDQITGVPGAVKLVFNDPNPFDEQTTAEWIGKIMQATPLDPFAVLPQEWVQKKFGVTPTESEYAPAQEPEA